ITVNSQAGYYHIKMDNEKTWVDFRIDENDLTTPIASDFQPDRFRSLIRYIKSDGKLSIPFTIGINILSIIRLLKDSVYKKYPELYSKLQVFIKVQEMTKKMIRTIEKKGKRLRSELQSTSTGKLVHNGICITSDIKPVSSESFYMVLFEHKQTKNKLYNANRQIKRLKVQCDHYFDIVEKEDNDDDELLALMIQDSIKEEKLGSTLLISTE
ncbi:8049_t:CDS:2, partial [Funneliformis caledonium]